MKNILLIILLLTSATTFAQQADYPWVNPDRNTRTHPPIAVPSPPSQMPASPVMPVALEAPADFDVHIIMHDDVTHFFVMPDGNVLGQGGNTYGWGVVGRVTAPPTGRTEFVYMVQLSGITYAVDKYGHVWQQQHPFRQIVGRVASVRK